MPGNKIKKLTGIFLTITAVFLVPICSVAQQQNQRNEKTLDKMGREIIKGPLGSGSYNNVHIISDSVGIQGELVMITNSVIEAPLCIRTRGLHSLIENNILICNLCIEFTDRVLIGNRVVYNECSGQGTNRPDVFGW